MYLGTIINPPSRVSNASVPWYLPVLCYEHAMIWNVPAMIIWATYLCIYVYEAPGVQPSRLGSKKVK